MSVRNLKKKSGTDWARIDKMTDDEIDTSDIPPLSDAFFEHAEKILPRSYVDRLDLLDAQKFAAYILDKGWPNKNEELAYTAFNMALVISYARPFGTRKDIDGQRELPLDKRVPDVLTEKEEIALHEHVRKMRNQSFAHSDARSTLFENLDYAGNQVVIFRRVKPLSKTQTSLLATMIEKWINYLEMEIKNFKRSRSRLS